MKTIIASVKNQMKYLVVFLALIIFSGQVYYGFIHSYEVEDINEKIADDKISSTTSPHIQEDICENKSTYLTSIITAVCKCTLAFLAGGLLSDMKFIKFGVI